MNPRRTNVLLTATLIAGLLAGCSGGSPTGCERGQPRPDDALLSLLRAAHTGDTAAAQQSLAPGFTVDGKLFEQLQLAVRADDIDSLKLTNPDQASSAYFFTAVTGQGTLIGSFEVHDLDNGCFGVAWGPWSE